MSSKRANFTVGQRNYTHDLIKPVGDYHFASVPRIGEKIVLDIDGESKVFEVFDVLHRAADADALSEIWVKPSKSLDKLRGSDTPPMVAWV